MSPKVGPLKITSFPVVPAIAANAALGRETRDGMGQLKRPERPSGSARIALH